MTIWESAEAVTVAHGRRAAGGALLALGFLWQGTACAPSVEGRLEDLLARRIHEPRLSTVTEWAPCGAPPSGLQPVSCAVRPAVEVEPEARDRITRGAFRVAGESTPEGHRNSLYLLVADSESSVDRAVASLRNAARERNDADLHNDLAVAYYVRAQNRSDPIDLIRALSAIERARELDTADPTVLFNRALILDRLHLLSSARQAWADYLEHDRSSEWGREAAERLAAVPADEVADLDPRHLAAEENPQAVREGLQEALGWWATAAEDDVRAARPLLQAAAASAEELRQVTGDVLLARSVAVIVTAGRSGDDRTEAGLIRGHRLYAEGIALIEERLYARAEPILRTAHRELNAAGTPFAGWAGLQLMRCAYQRQRADEVEELGAELLATLGNSGASALRGRVLWVLGSSRFLGGDLRTAGDAFRRAEEEFERLGERRNELAVRYRHAGLLEWTGRLDEAMRQRYDVLTKLRWSPWSASTDRRLMAPDLAYMALDLGEDAAAPALQDEAVTIARSAPGSDSLPLTNALLKRAGVRRRVGDAPGAEQDLAEAERMLGLIEDPDRRAATLAQLRLEEGRLLQSTAPERARAALDEALAIHRDRQAHLLVTEVQLEAARVQRELDHPDRAEEQLTAGIEELERQRATVESDGDRIALSDRAAETYDELVDLLLERGRVDEALRMAEQARARRLKEWWGLPDGGSPVAAALSDIPRPRGNQAVIVYSLLPERLAVWLLTKEDLHHVSVPIAAPVLRRQVRDTREAIRLDAPDVDQRLTELYGLLIAPLAAAIADRSELLLLPDEELYLVPFAALRESTTGRFLLEDHRITLAPTLAMPAPGGRDTGSARPGSVLVLADPAFDRGAHPRLPQLPGAEREGMLVAAEYPEAMLLTAGEATADSFLGNLGRYRTVHIAAHALADARDPFRSRLVLAPDPGRPTGELEAREILQSEGPVPQLVILAACGTVGSQVSRNEGALGLAWAFLARGSSSVVASLWQLEDSASRELFTHFHSELAGGLSAAEALRTSQLSAWAAGAATRDWASVVLFSRTQTDQAVALPSPKLTSSSH